MSEQNFSQEDWMSSPDFWETGPGRAVSFAVFLLVSCSVGAGVLTLIGKSLER